MCGDPVHLSNTSWIQLSGSADLLVKQVLECESGLRVDQFSKKMLPLLVIDCLDAWRIPKEGYATGDELYGNTIPGPSSGGFGGMGNIFGGFSG